MTTRKLFRHLSGGAALVGGASALLLSCATAPTPSTVASASPVPGNGITAPWASALPASGSVLIAEALHLVETLGDGVWPGFGRTNAPVLYIAGEREYAVGFPQPLEGFEAVAGQMIAGRSLQEGPRTHEPNLAASFPVQGVDAVVIGTPESLALSPTQWTLTAAHEMFHVFQHHHGWDDKVASLEIGPRDNADWQLNFPFPYKNPDIGSLLHLVSYPTFLAIEASSPADAAYNVGVALEALAVLNGTLLAMTGDARAQRYMLFQEATEGAAKYVERRIAEGATVRQYEPTAAFVSLPGYVRYAEVWETDYTRQTFLVKHGGRVARSRTEFYHLGLGKCLVLDRLDPTWKQRYFDTGVWLPNLIQAALRASEKPGK